MRWLLVLASLAAPGAAAAISLDDAVETALRNDPQLRGLEEERKAALQAREAAGSLLGDNPVLSIEAGPMYGDGESFAAYVVALQQPFELAGKGGLRRSAADAEVARSRVQVALRRRELAAQVREAFVETLAAAERERIATADAQFATQAAGVADARLAEGRMSRLARNAAHVDQARAARALAAAAVDTARARAALRRLLGAPPGEPVDAEGTLAALAHRTAAEPPAQVHRLEVEEARLARQSAAARSDLAHAERVPDLTVALSFERELGDDRISAALAFPLPIFETNGQARADARRELARAQVTLAETERTVDAERAEADALLAAARAAVDAFADEAVRALDENVRLATEAFRSGDIGAGEFLLLRREALEGQLAWVQALEELALAQVAWERAAGAP